MTSNLIINKKYFLVYDVIKNGISKSTKQTLKNLKNSATDDEVFDFVSVLSTILENNDPDLIREESYLISQGE